MKCILCKSEAQLIKKDFVGIKYITMEGKEEVVTTNRSYDIWHCGICDTRFVSPYESIDYEQVYTKTNIYDGLVEFAEKIKNDSDPWWSLIGRGQQYYAALDFVKNKEIHWGLEAGCGFGYMTFALQKLGYNFIGTEVSEYVVKKAKELYGDIFYNTDIKFLKPSEPFDVIISLEVIEHLADPLEFMKSIKELLKDDGSALITTPAREYFEMMKNGSGQSMLVMGWNGEMPPIHLAMYSKKSMGWIAKELEMKLSFTDFPGGPNQTMGAVFTK